MNALDTASTTKRGNSASPNALYRNLLIATFFERFSYYGFRSIIVLYAIQELMLDDVDVFYQYGIFTSVTYLGYAFGGVLGDFVLGTKRAIIIGSLIATAGFFVASLAGISTFYLSLVLFLIGMGLIRPNVTAGVAKVYANSPNKLLGRFSLFYLLINFGAFFGVFLVMLVSESLGWTWGFILVGITQLIATVFFALDKGTISFSYPSPPPTIKRRGVNVALLLIPTIFVALYWFLYEFYGQLTWELQYSIMELFEVNSIPRHLVIQIPTILLVILGVPTIIVLWKKKVKLLRWLALGFVFAAISFLTLKFVSSSFRANSAVVFYVLFLFIQVIAELIIVPTMLAAYGKYVPQRVLGTVIGVSFLITAIFLRISGAIGPIESGNPLMIWIGIAFLIIGALVIYFISPAVRNKTNDSTPEKESDILDEFLSE